MRELVPVPEVSGLHLYAPTAEFAAGVDTCYEMLAHLGGAVVVTSIQALVGSAQASESCRYESGIAIGVDFSLELGSAYFVALVQKVELPSGRPPGCPATDLSPGANLVGVAQPRQGLTCYDLLQAFGPGAVSAVERLDKNRDAFVSCSTQDGISSSGVDYPLRPAEGYIVHSRVSVSGVNLNNLSHANCQ